MPEQPRAVVCFIHGAFEHSGRFVSVCAYLAEAGYCVHALDLRGHGRSQGEVGPDTSFFTLLDDINVFIRGIKAEHAGVPVFLLGQSLGGALALMSAPDTAPAGVVLCAPACRLVFPPVSIIAAYALAKLAPDLKLKSLESKLLARDPAVALAYENDPLVNRQGIPLRPLTEFMRCMRAKQLEFERSGIPFTVFHGTEDKVVDIRGSRELVQRAASGDKKLEELPGFYHDLLNDTGCQRVFKDIATWIDARL